MSARTDQPDGLEVPDAAGTEAFRGAGNCARSDHGPHPEGG